jgi:hypothetical protein
VSRGVCEVDENGNLSSINERTKIYGDGSKIVYEDANGKLVEVPVTSTVSMNFWCFDTSVFSYTEKLFKAFLAKNLEDPKSEFFIPIVADDFIQSGNGVVKMIPTSSQWFGVTYKEDAPSVQASLDKLVAAGEYPSVFGRRVYNISVVKCHDAWHFFLFNNFRGTHRDLYLYKKKSRICRTVDIKKQYKFLLLINNSSH